MSKDTHLTHHDFTNRVAELLSPAALALFNGTCQENIDDYYVAYQRGEVSVTNVASDFEIDALESRATEQG